MLCQQVCFSVIGGLKKYLTLFKTYRPCYCRIYLLSLKHNPMNMKTTKLIFTVLFCLSVSATFASGFIQNGNFITVRVSSQALKGPLQVRLQVLNDNIIRVEATAEKTFPIKKSLIILPQPLFLQYKVTEEHGQLIVSTKKIQARLDEKTGRISFYSADGKILYLSEDAREGKTFTPFTVPDREVGAGKLTDEQKHGWTWRAVFDSPKDEAFYGLGQHQSNELNMKDRNEDLFQYNTKISVPFVVSNKNYGILWDSYSYCRFGNPNPYLQLNRAFTLYNKEGKSGSLTGTYVGADSSQLVRREDSIYFENSETIGNLPKGFKLKGAHVIYEGYISAPVDNLYRFILYYAGYTKVFIGGKEVVPERWRTAWNPNAWKFEVLLKKGVREKILIDWHPDGDVSYCGLRVARPQSENEQSKLSIWSEMSRDMDYYFIAGKNIDQVISGYRTLTGKAQVYPKWALGYWQSRERYKTSGEIERTLKEFRKRHIPIDNIVQDWNYWKLDSWGSHQFDITRYPDPQAMMDSIHAMHAHFMISVWPKFYCSVKNYKELDAHGWIYHQAVKDSIYDWLGFMGSFYDAYAPGARKLFWKQMNDNLYRKYNFGVDAWWMDASEPNVRDCTPMWYRKALSGPTYLGSSTEFFNAYSLVNADAIYNGQRSVNPNQRVFLLTRSGFAGLQRYGTASWGGDIACRWEDMRAQMTAGLNYSLAGLPIWGMDQGGFTPEDRYTSLWSKGMMNESNNVDLKEWRELQSRWCQFGAFVPLFRAHGQGLYREPWNISPEGSPAYKSIIYYDRLRYRLMPYIYSLDGAIHFKDYTPMRALVMDYEKDDKVLDIKDQWMFGPSLMVCPVGYYGVRRRNVYLPKQNDWYDLYTNKYYKGGQTIDADAPYEKIPVFVPAGAILIYGPAIEWTDEKPADTLSVYVYAGKDGHFTLYEDEGTNYNYEKGMYSMIDLIYNDKQHTLSIETRKGSFKGMLQKRIFKVVYRTQNNQVKNLNLDAAYDKWIKYTGKRVIIKL